MKKKISYKVNKKMVEREVNYIPVRYIVAVLITLFEVVAVVGDIQKDMEDTFEKSILIKKEDIKTNLFQRAVRSIVRIFAPLL